jgi:serine/threonine protein kinase
MEDLSQYQETSVGSYRLFQLVGVGPVSRAHLAERKDWPGSKVVVKLFEAVPLHSRDERDRLLEEVRLLTYLEHPSLLPILDDGIHENTLYLVSPFIEGGSLRQRLKAAGGELLPLKEALAVLSQVGEALHFAHSQGVVHANLKPENILLQRDGKVLLADFLLPTLAKSERATRLLSTFAAFYMSPEQFGGVPTPLSDQYALACLAYELLTGQPPFEADNLTLLARLHATQQPTSPARLQPKRAQHVEQAILKALAKRPEKRYPDMLAFLADLSAPPPLVAPAIAQVTTPPQEQTSLATLADTAIAASLSTDASEQPSTSGVHEEAIRLLPAVIAGSFTEEQSASQLLVPSQQTALQVRKRPGSRLSRWQNWIAVALIGALMLVSLSGLWLFFRVSPANHTQAHTSVPTATLQSAAPSPNPTLPGVTPTATVASISLPPSPTATSRPSPTTAPTSGASPTVTSALALSCSVNYQARPQGSNNFIANLTVTNTGTATIQGWTLVFSFAAGQSISGGWNGHFTQNGARVSVTNKGSNATIAPGSSVSPGFFGSLSGSGSNPAPTVFTLNGVTCQ